MQEYISFFLEHWLLSLIAVLLIIALLVLELRGKVGGALRVSAKQAVEMMNRQQAVIVDTRDRNAFKAGHIINAVHVNVSEVNSDHAQLAKHKDNPIIIVCANGTQAPNLAAKLHKQGFSKAYYLQGGLASWKQENLPVVK